MVLRQTTQRRPFHRSIPSAAVALLAAAVLIPCLWVATNSQLQAAGGDLPAHMLPLEDTVIDYYTAEVSDPVAKLARRIQEGKTKLAFDPQRGYLPAVLKELKIPASSQTLVFSRTSLQLNKISPQTPRAIYFNDEVYIGWCRNGDVLEVASTDPRQGTIFYTLKQEKAAAPAFERATDSCLTCHATVRTLGVPGLLVRSVHTNDRGIPMLQNGNFTTDHRSPLLERWGGWYVSGRHGKMKHMGNVWLPDGGGRESVDTVSGQNVTDLRPYFDTDPYLSPHSDIVALMVMEHQAQLHNMITRLNYETRLSMRDYKRLAATDPGNPGTPGNPGNPDSVTPGNPAAAGQGTPAVSPEAMKRIKRVADAMLRYMLFVDEAHLKGSISGVSDFARDFQAAGPRDRQGRSLRDLSLKKWLFKYPCSYLIYSESFDQLPAPALDYLYQRLHEILTGKDQSTEFALLSREDRKAILEILLDTKKSLPAYWRK